MHSIMLLEHIWHEVPKVQSETTEKELHLFTILDGDVVIEFKEQAERINFTKVASAPSVLLASFFLPTQILPFPGIRGYPGTPPPTEGHQNEGQCNGAAPPPAFSSLLSPPQPLPCSGLTRQPQIQRRLALKPEEGVEIDGFYEKAKLHGEAIMLWKR